VGGVGGWVGGVGGGGGGDSREMMRKYIFELHYMYVCV